MFLFTFSPLKRDMVALYYIYYIHNQDIGDISGSLSVANSYLLHFGCHQSRFCVLRHVKLLTVLQCRLLSQGGYWRKKDPEKGEQHATG
jgi:hypothetical protein